MINFVKWLWSFHHKPLWKVVWDVTMWRIRWSRLDREGRYFWIKHYVGTTSTQEMAEQIAKELNSEGKTPKEWNGSWWKK